ncbi:unnamed protein product [Caenorhabditis auriculariae]|uniref:SKA complex subunit 1 n=1 Tax=Caenorhabditis auriculariae TaxID=2777116 RepID=A0A8S1GS54_9PELO|nr:unnamed protein product [Caenorhabditis auriculariae]
MCKCALRSIFLRANAERSIPTSMSSENDVVNLLHAKFEQTRQFYSDYLSETTMKKLSAPLKNLLNEASELNSKYLKLNEELQDVDKTRETEFESIVDTLAQSLGIDLSEVKERKVEAGPSTNVSDSILEEKSKGTAQVEEEKEKEVVAQPAKPKTLVPLLEKEDFESIPKYMRGRFTIDDLNEMVSKFDEFITKKRTLLRKPPKLLTKNERLLVDQWRELEVMKTRSPYFCFDTDIKPLIQERLRPQLLKAIPCLRHVRRITEERVGNKTVYHHC